MTPCRNRRSVIITVGRRFATPLCSAGGLPGKRGKKNPVEQPEGRATGPEQRRGRQDGNRWAAFVKREKGEGWVRAARAPRPGADRWRCRRLKPPRRPPGTRRRPRPGGRRPLRLPPGIGGSPGWGRPGPGPQGVQDLRHAVSSGVNGGRVHDSSLVRHLTFRPSRPPDLVWVVPEVAIGRPGRGRGPVVPPLFRLIAGPWATPVV